ncbi:MAG: DUF1998 domain-containing protein, partial [Desulfovibrio sp.]|nr:DUF1998 domain-containing protein [Desulfovibrio sp.]
IGGLDICILVGYPGTIMSTLQRGGRVGRARQESCVIMIAGEDALDQYFIHNPDDFFQRPPEKAVVNPDNEVIAARHIECAAAEYPLGLTEEWIQGKAMQGSIQTLITQGKLLLTHDGQNLVACSKNPQRGISLRSSGNTCVIEDQTRRVIGSIDTFRAWHEAHPGAIYIHRGKIYEITHFDPNKGLIQAKAEHANWFTRVRSQKSTIILEENERMGLGRSFIARGRLRITDTITGYEKRSNYGNKLLDIVPLSVPPFIFETEGLWYVIPDSLRKNLEEQFIHFMGAIHACEHAMIGLLPLQVMADRNDFGGISTPLHPQIGASAIFIYDGIPGGAGLTKEAYSQGRAILEDTYKGIARCPCSDGCPSCVHSPKCGSGNRPISKSGAIFLLQELLKPGHEGDILAKTLVLSPPIHPPFLETKAIQTNTEKGTGVHAAEEISQAHQSQKQKESTPCSQRTIPKPQARNTPPAHYVVFDVETRLSAEEVGGWNHASSMGVSISVAYDSLNKTFLRFEQEDLPELFSLFQKADLIIGFNSLRFDYAVLSPFAPFDLWSLPSLDLLQKINEKLHYRISLDSFAQATLGSLKSGNGKIALTWWKEQRLDAIAEYCQQDVRLTRDLYLFGLKNQYLFFTSKNKQKVRVDVDFSNTVTAKVNDNNTSLQ